MPSVEEGIQTDRSNLTRVEQLSENKPSAAPPDPKLNSLLKSPYQRCPLPPSNNSADSLRQWGQGSDVPRFRTQTPPSNVVGSGGTVISTGVVIGGGSSTTPTPASVTLPPAQNVSLTTPALSPSQTWIGSIQMAKAFMILNVTGSSFCRTELYSTANARALDLSRPVTQAPSNTTQGLILDVVLLTSLSWKVLDCVGSNGDSPQSATAYCTITNLSTAVQAFTVSIQFVPQES